MKSIGIIPNMSKKGWLEYTENVIGWIAERGLKPLISYKTAENGGFAFAEAVADERLYSETDFIVVLGGDGTILGVSGKCAVNNVPLLGINLGTLGYLTDADKKDGFYALEKALNGDCVMEKRMMLEAEVYLSGCLIEYDEPLIALNDVCVTKSVYSKLITLELYINGEYINALRADGLIISTPTGSTAYNLSAGGPILKPDAEMIAVTPICPHALHSRPWVISADDTLEIRLDDNVNNECILSLDGRNGANVKNGDSIRVRKSAYYTTIIKTGRLNFYDVLRTKMMS